MSDLYAPADSFPYSFLIYVSAASKIGDNDEFKVHLSNEQLWLHNQERQAQETAYTISICHLLSIIYNNLTFKLFLHSFR